MSKRGIVGALGAVGLISLLTLASRAVGFLRWFAQFAWVGQGETANAYATANQIPNIVFEVAVGGALAGVTVPLLAGPVAAKMRADIDRIAGAILTIVLTVLIPLGVLVWLLAEVIAGWFPIPQGGDPVAQGELLAVFLRIFALQIPLYGISVVLGGVLQAHEKFFWPAFGPLLSSLVVIGCYAAYGYCGGASDFAAEVTPRAVLILGWGTTFGVVALSLPYFVPVHRLGVRLRLGYHLRGKEARRALSLAGAGVGALLAQQFAAIAVLVLARGYGSVSTVSVYQYSQGVYMLPYAVLAFPIATALFPKLSRLAAEPLNDKFRHAVASSSAIIAEVAMLSAALLIAVARPVQGVFELLKAVPEMDATLLAFAPGIIGFILIFHLSRIFWAVSRARTAVLATASGWFMVVPLSWLAIHLIAKPGGDGMGTLIGLGIGSSAGMTIAGIGLLIGLKRAGYGEAVSGVVVAVLKSGVPMLIAAVVSHLLANWVFVQLSGLIAILVSGVLALLLMMLSAIPTYRRFRKMNREMKEL
ncbi:MAG: lipid II flippase MurJ [Varibaculum sp.]|nr:lipid II flippase MurJ [Varibaculum sp.]